MLSRKLVSLGSLISKIDNIEEILNNVFSCHKNLEVENFLHKKAIDFEKRLLAKTFLIYENGKILAYFSLTFKEINARNESKSLVKKLNGGLSTTNIKTFLIGQIGKNQAIENNSIHLSEIVTFILDKLKQAQEIIGGRVIILECEDNQRLISLYEEQGFKLLNVADDATKLKTMFITF